ncbi:DUF2155 domain-containing protein [Hyphomicrobium sp.]|uniref:DUF2155 domain-containing protein n=1 Tax=Hyphomicrobium sp. TaxID=82 RepID=UPI0039C889F1
MSGQRPHLRAGQILLLALSSSAFAAGVMPAAAQERLDNRVAVFSALDKVTATIKTLEIPINETVQFGALKVTPRTCYSRPPTEQPKTTTFVEVDEVQLDGKEKRIFTGWMFAQSPGLNAVEHPVFDVWLTDCQKPRNAIVQQQPAAPGADPGTEEALPPPADQDAGEFQRRRVRR